MKSQLAIVVLMLLEVGCSRPEVPGGALLRAFEQDDGEVSMGEVSAALDSAESDGRCIGRAVSWPWGANVSRGDVPMSVDAPLYVLDELPFRDETARKFKIRAVIGRWSPGSSGPPDLELRYSRNGVRTVLVRTAKNEGGKPTSETFYDSTGRPRETVYSKAGATDGRVIYVYDKSTEWQRIVSFGPDGALETTRQAERDRGGRLVRTSTYNAKGEQIGRATYNYDSRGQLSAVDMEDLTARKFDYDSEGRLIRSEESRPSMGLCDGRREAEYAVDGLLERIVRPTMIGWKCGALTIDYVFSQ